MTNKAEVGMYSESDTRKDYLFAGINPALVETFLSAAKRLRRVPLTSEDQQSAGEMKPAALTNLTMTPVTARFSNKMIKRYNDFHAKETA